MMEDRWLSVDEIAAYLGIKRDTVYKWIADKKMPAHRMGRLWKFRKDEVDGWVKSAVALMIGNALPPPFVTAHARLIRNTLQHKGRKEA